MISARVKALLLIFILLPLAYAANLGSQEARGRYVPIALIISPAFIDLGDLTEGEIVAYNITVENPHSFSLNATYAISTPAFILAEIQGWESGTYKIVSAQSSGTATVIISIGRPFLPDVAQDFNISISFYGTRIK